MATPVLTDEQKMTLAALTHKFSELGFAVKPLADITVGPVISIYRFVPQGTTRVGQMEKMADDFSVLLGQEVFVKRMPGEAAVSIAVPNKERSLVNWKQTATDVWKYYAEHPASIPLGFGVDYLGKPFIENLTELPHLLIAGSTGGGKSFLMNAILASLIYTMPTSKLQLVLSDTKGVEFVHFIGAPHLLFQPATTVFQTLEQMEWLVQTTEDRLKEIARGGARNIQDLNASGKEMPYIVFCIDELATILGGSSKSKSGEARLAEAKLEKIVQLSRATGIYVIAATQRPSGDVVKGVIKANFPARLSFRLPSETDSKYAIGDSGAERLQKQGDMLYVSSVRPGLHRLHSPFVELTDIKGAVEAAIMRG